MHDIKYVIHKEGKYYVARSLNVEVSSFGETADEAIANLREALELYFEDESAGQVTDVQEERLGKIAIAG